jgi:hypothetical protein
MTAAFRCIRKTFTSVILLLLICPCSVSALAGSGYGNQSPIAMQGLDVNITNQSFSGGERLPEFAEGPTPVEIFRAELNQETLPGPRYMAFGPSVIGISIDPRVLAVCFAIVLIVLVVWFVSIRNRDDEREKGSK